MAGLLKQYLRDLPEPLLTYPLFVVLGSISQSLCTQAFIRTRGARRTAAWTLIPGPCVPRGRRRAVSDADPRVKPRYYRAVLKALPLNNYLTLRRLLGFLCALAAHSAQTKMGSVVR